MARKIGIFQSERQVVDAIEQLEQSGFTPGEITVLAKDSEHSRRIEAETDVHADEMLELSRTNYRSRGDDGTAEAVEGAGVFATPVAPAYGLASFGSGSPASGAGAMFAIPSLVTDDNFDRAFRTLGLDAKEASLCSREVMAGGWAVIARTDESKSLLDKDGGPDLSTLGIAEAVFRRCGASRIADGS